MEGYYCPQWTQRIPAHTTGTTAEELWDEYGCHDWVGEETVYLTYTGDTVDRGDLTNERCDSHGETLDWNWVDEIYVRAHETLLERGWQTCPHCEPDEEHPWNNPLYPTDEYRQQHQQGAHGLLHARRPEVEETVTTPPPPPTLNQPENERTWWTDIPMSPNPAMDLNLYRLISDYTQNVIMTRNPVGHWIGARINPATGHFIMLRTQRDYDLVPAHDYHHVKFLSTPPHSVASTESMWAAS